MPEQAENPKFVGCQWCTRGHRPTWRFDANIIGGGEWIHIERIKIDKQSETVAVTICTAGK